MNIRMLVSVYLGLSALSACGGEDPAAEGGGIQLAQQESSELDFDNLDVCELVPGATVSGALGGMLTDPPPLPTTIAGLGTQCLYTVEIDGMNVDARISMSPPDYWLGDEDARSLDGLGDEAYTTETDIGVNGTVYDIYVLVRGKAEVNVTSNTLERAEILARLALEAL